MRNNFEPSGGCTRQSHKTVTTLTNQGVHVGCLVLRLISKDACGGRATSFSMFQFYFAQVDEKFISGTVQAGRAVPQNNWITKQTLAHRSKSSSTYAGCPALLFALKDRSQQICGEIWTWSILRCQKRMSSPDWQKQSILAGKPTTRNAVNLSWWPL